MNILTCTLTRLTMGRRLWELQHKHLVLKGVSFGLGFQRGMFWGGWDNAWEWCGENGKFWSYGESLADFSEDRRVCGNLGWNSNGATETACREHLLEKLQMQLTWGFYASMRFDWQDSLRIIWINVILSYWSYAMLRCAPCVETYCGAHF